MHGGYDGCHTVDESPQLLQMPLNPGGSHDCIHDKKQMPKMTEKSRMDYPYNHMQERMAQKADAAHGDVNED